MKDLSWHPESPFASEAIGPDRADSWSPRLAKLIDESPFVRLVGREQPLDAVEQLVHDDEVLGVQTGCCGAGAHEFEDEDAPLDLQTEWVDAEIWAGSSEQMAFRDRVLAAHLARKKAVSGAPLRDLSHEESKTLKNVPGTDIRTLPETAAAAGRLLAAANADLAKAQRAGDADALRTIRLSATSGHRSSQVQRDLWLRYFSAKGGYYDLTQAARENLAQGPHSEQAVAYMLRSVDKGGFGLGGRIAAPGYSNHQAGIAIDFWQERRKGHRIRNKSDPKSRAKWRATWFHRVWLKSNHANHGFKPIATEEWHWEYRPGSAPAASTSSTASHGSARSGESSVRDHLGGKLWTFSAKTLATRVAVFCPKAAVGSGQVQMLLFAHGLLGGCARPKHVPEGFISETPFHLGRIIDASGRPLVLVVPSLDWADPGGERAFGSGHERWHALAKPSNLNAVLAEALVELGRVQAIAAPSLRGLVIAGHSRAYDFLEPLAHSGSDAQMRQGALAKLSQVWSFDTTYAGRVKRWIDWLNLDARLQVAMFYRPGSKTAAIGDEFYRQRGARLAVTRASEGHCEVPVTRLPALLKLPAADDGETGHAVTADDEDGLDIYEAHDEPGEAEEIDEFECDPPPSGDAQDEWGDAGDGDSEDTTPARDLEGDLSEMLTLDVPEAAPFESNDEETDFDSPSAGFAGT